VADAYAIKHVTSKIKCTEPGSVQEPATLKDVHVTAETVHRTIWIAVYVIHHATARAVGVHHATADMEEADVVGHVITDAIVRLLRVHVIGYVTHRQDHVLATEDVTNSNLVKPVMDATCI